MAISPAIARRYAEAYFRLAREGDAIEKWGADLARTAEILGDARVLSVLRNPRLTSAERVKIALDLLRDSPDHARNLARLLVERGRADLIGLVLDHHRRLADRASGIVRAEVTTAVDLDSSIKQRIARTLEERLGASVRTELRTDPSILGGMVVRIGDRVIDDSVHTHLQQLQASLA